MPSFSTGQRMACAPDGTLMVTVANRASVQQVAQAGAPWSMSIANLPALQTISGSVTVSGTVTVSNLPSVQAVKEPSIRGVAALGSASASGLLLSVAAAGGATLTFADGSSIKAYFPAGTFYYRAAIASITPGAVGGALSALTLADAKATIES